MELHVPEPDFGHVDLQISDDPWSSRQVVWSGRDSGRIRQLTARATCCQFGEVEEGEHHCASAVAFMVAGGGFEPPTFGL